MKVGTASETRGFGLLGIRERIEALHGTVEITSLSDRGATVKLEVPIQHTSAENLQQSDAENIERTESEVTNNGGQS
jgi:signal transduction histidine kinase